MVAYLRRFSFLFCLALLAAGSTRAADGGVVIVSSERSAAYQEATGALLAELEQGGIATRDVLQITSLELAKADALAPRLYLALGTEACAALARSTAKPAVLCTLLPRQSFERVLRESGRKASAQFTALYLNQPLTRQFDLVRLALPQSLRVGVLLSSDLQGHQEASLDELAEARGMKLVRVLVNPEQSVYSGLKRILDESDVLLALADPQIYNSSSIQNILLASFRAQVPMLAFSPAYVRAGALLAVYSSPAQIGQQAGLLARGALQGRALGLPQYPQDFQVSVNEHVARSLGLSLEPQALTERLRRLEKKP
jgi:putative tryptophan/tyrosine transport system substrate-binding protein